MKDYLVKFDANGKPEKAFAKWVHYTVNDAGETQNISIDVEDEIKNGAVFISADDYNKILGNGADGKKYIRQSDGSLAPEPDPEPPTLEERKVAKAQETRAWANKMMRSVQAGYSQPEISSFAQQRAGAEDILAGEELTENAQAVIGLLTVRLGLTGNDEPTAEQKKEFAQRIINNATTASSALIKLMGTQQRLELAIRAATTEEQFSTVCAQVDAVIKNDEVQG